MMLNEKERIRMSIFTKSLIVAFLCMVGASLGYCETVGESQKVSSTTNLLPAALSKSQMHEMIWLIATNLLPLLELQMEVNCFSIARVLHNYPTDEKKLKLLEHETLMKHQIKCHVQQSLAPFFERVDDGRDEIKAANSYLELLKYNAVQGWYGDGGGKAPPYETAVKEAKPSLQITHAILRSHFKAIMYAEVADVLLEQLKDKDKLAFDAITDAMNLIELDKKDSVKATISNGDKK